MPRCTLKRAVTALLIFLPLFVIPPGNAQEARWKATIVDVEDGNSLLTDEGVKLRLIDIRLLEGEAHRGRLVEYLEDRVKGKNVSLEKDYKELDKDGARLVYLFLDEELINGEVLSKGLALMKRRTVNVRYQIKLFKSQAEAYKAGYGLWGGRKIPGAAGQAVGTSTAGGDTTSLTRPVRYEMEEKEVLVSTEQMNNDGVKKAGKGDLEGAMTDWERSAQLTPDSYPPRFNLALGMIEQGRYEEAGELIKKLMKNKSKDVRLNTAMGKALLGQDKPDEAIAAHKKALDIQPDLYEAKLNIAQIHEAAGNFERALYEYNRAAEDSPWDPYLYLKLGELNQDMGEKDQAQENYKKSLELSPGAGFTATVQGKPDVMEAEKGLPIDALNELLFPGLV